MQGGGVAKGTRLQAGQIVVVRRAPMVLEAPALLPPVIFEDEHLIAVDKPPGLPSHPLRAGEGPTAAGAVVTLCPGCAEASEDPREGGIGHRLDAGTSGVLVAAKTRTAWVGLRKALAGGDSQKTYLAQVAFEPQPAVRPHVTCADQLIIVTTGIGRTGRRGSRVKVSGGRGELPARTEVRVVARWGTSSLVEATLASGRTHQVRVHLAYLGCPILGDDVYGDPSATTLALKLGVQGFRLHAARVAFLHPITKAQIFITAPHPAWARGE